MGSGPENKQSRRGSFQDIGRRLDEEVEELICWFNDEVVPSIRKRSTGTLRKAAEKLSQLADQMDDIDRKK